MSNAMRSGKRLLAGVAAGALGLGLLSFVAASPAQAAVTNPTSITASQFGPLRTASGIDQTLNIRVAGTTDDTMYRQNIGLVINGVSLFGADSATSLSGGGFTLAGTGASNTASIAYAAGGTAVTGFTLQATTAAPGTYTAFVYSANNTGANAVPAAYTGTNQTKSANFTVTISGPPTGVSLSPTTEVAEGGTAAKAFVSLTDAAGRQTVLSGSEAFNITASTGAGTVSTPTGTSVTGGTTTSLVLAASDYAAGLVTFNGREVSIINSDNAVKNVTFTPNAVLQTGGVTTGRTISVSWVAKATASIAVNGTSVIVPTSAIRNGNENWSVSTGTTAITVRAQTDDSVGVSIPYSVESNPIFGTALFQQSGVVVTNASGQANLPLTIPAGAAVNGNSLSVTFYANTTRTLTVGFLTGTPALTIDSPSSSPITAAVASTTPVVALVEDQFGNPVSGAIVTFSLPAGTRNNPSSTAALNTNATTGADGTATFQLADTSTSTTNLTTVVNVTAQTSAGTAISGTPQLIVNYGNPTLLSLTASTSNPAVATITTASDVAGTTARGVFTVTATPTGVPVTITAPAGTKMSTTAAFNWTSSTAVTSLTVYPNAGGTPIYVASNASGVKTFSLAGGGLTASVSFTFTSPQASARTLTVTPATAETRPGTTVSMTATVTDGWGNPVPNVQVAGAVTGIAYFGAAQPSATANTNASGVATFILVSPAGLTGQSIVTFGLSGAQTQDAAGVPITGFPAGSGTSTVTITTTSGPTPGDKTIVIAGERGTVSGKSGIIVDGATKGFDVGSAMVPSLRFPGETTFTAGSARPTTNAAGDFSWQRKTGKQVTVFFSNEAGDIRSNRVTIKTS